jgi:integrase
MATITELHTNDGRKRYRAQVRLKGVPSQCRTFDRRTDAKKWIASIESSIHEGRHFPGAEAKRRTLRETIERYKATELTRKSIAEQRKRGSQLDWWSKKLGHLVLADVAPSKIVEMRDRLFVEPTIGKRPLRSNSTINRYLAALSHVFTMATREWGWMDSNPISKVRKMPEPKGRVRFLDQDELKRLRIAASQSRNKVLGLVLEMALATGSRQSELLGLHWSDVDLGTGRITLRDTKNGETRVVTLPKAVLDMLRAHGQVRYTTTNLLFPSQAAISGAKPNHRANIRTAWERAIERADIKDFHFHDLRHTTASYLAMSNATLAEIAAVLGHKTLQMVKRYTHVSEDHTANLVASMHDKFLGGE